MRNLLAFDLGASNGRAILGQFDGEKITMRELHRFENNYIEMNGVFYWDLPYLYNQLKQGFLAFKNANVGELDCFGIDTWGVDYGLLDKNDQLLSNPRSYRYAVDADMEAVWKTVDFPTLFARTGIATMNFNTVYQLYRRKLQDDPALANAQTLLFMPEDVVWFGVLTLLGSAMLLTGLVQKWLQKIPPAVGLAVSLILFALTYHTMDGYWGLGLLRWALPQGLYANYLTAYFGFYPVSFYSSDYFPLLPWLFLFWAGYYLHPLVGRKRMEPLRRSVCPPLGWLGRHSLVLYLLHQPVIFGVLTLVFTVPQLL